MTRRGIHGFTWRGKVRGTPFGAETPSKPCVWVDEPVYERVKAYALEQGITVREALERMVRG